MPRSDTQHPETRVEAPRRLHSRKEKADAVRAKLDDDVEADHLGRMGFGTPDTGLISFASRHPMPEPGAKRMLFRQPLHDFEYAAFQGEIPEGYGAGTVRKEEEDEIVLTRLDDDRISFYTTHRKRPEFYTMIRQDGEGDPGQEPWLLVNVTPSICRHLPTSTTLTSTAQNSGDGLAPWNESVGHPGNIHVPTPQRSRNRGP